MLLIMDEGCKDDSVPKGRGVKGRVLGEDGERCALGTHGCAGPQGAGDEV